MITGFLVYEKNQRTGEVALQLRALIVFVEGALFWPLCVHCTYMHINTLIHEVKTNLINSVFLDARLRGFVIDNLDYEYNTILKGWTDESTITYDSSSRRPSAL